MPEVYTAFENEDLFSSGYELQAMNSRGIYSPSSGSQETASVSSVLSSLHDNELNDISVIGNPYITILEQPTEKFRFRYKSEMVGTHGSLVGSNRKNVPTVQLHNFLDPAVIRCSLVTSDEGLPRIPHAHKLIRRDAGQDYDDLHYITVSSETEYTAIFQGMSIIHTAKRHIRDELIKKMRLEALEKKKNTNIKATLNSREEAQIKVDAEHYQKHMNLNSVALCFQAFVTNDCGVMIPITEPVYSHTINNLKSALTGELKICRMDKLTSSVEGGEEIFILVEKVGKKNIKIKLFELNENGCEIWSAYGRFSELDVHHQYAIVFRTPPYKDQDITLPKNVFIQLERPSDGESSDARKFTYKPSDKIIGRKRQRISYSGSSELSYIIPNTNSIGNENMSELLSNSNSHELSKEIKKLLSEGTTTPVCKDFLNDIDFDNYFKLLLNSEENMLGTDGPSIIQHQDDVMFARNILTEIMQCMKMDVKNMEEYIQKLLKDRSTYGDSPLHSALRYGQHNIVKYLLMLLCTNKDCKTLINSQNSSGKTPLHYSVLQNQPEITKALLMLGADPNRTDDHGFSPLHVAVKISDASACVDVLLAEKGIDIEAYNDAGWTALHLATKAGSYDAICSLVHAGANVNNTDMSYGRTALHIAVEGGHKKIVEYLLKKTNISVNKRNFSGNTALHTAVVHTGTRAKELCASLIQHGADPHIQNHNRKLNDVNKKKESHVNVKVEVHSEDENIEGTIGQSSFDLAMNKPDILQVFNGQFEKTTNKMCSVTTKLELKNEDLQTNWLNNEHKEKLSILLDKTQGWQKLAKHLNIEYLLQTFQHNSISPSLGLLNYIDVETILSLMDMQTLLREIGEEEAADYINEISSICS